MKYLHGSKLIFNPIQHSFAQSEKSNKLMNPIAFWLRGELKKCKCMFVCLSGEKCSRALNLHLFGPVRSSRNANVRPSVCLSVCLFVL